MNNSNYCKTIRFLSLSHTCMYVFILKLDYLEGYVRDCDYKKQTVSVFIGVYYPRII